MKTTPTITAALLLTWIVLPAAADMHGGAPAEAQAETPKNLVQAELIADAETVERGKPFQVGVLLKVKPDWYVYWKHPGEAGMATAVEFDVPDGYTVGPLAWPRPSEFEAPGEITSYGYKDEVLLTATVTPPEDGQAAGPVPVSAHVSWLACKEKCIPGDARLDLQIHTVEDPADAKPAHAELFETWAERTPPPAPKLTLADQDGNEVALADLKGEIVVLEWINPDCPFVKRHHVQRDTMTGLARRYASEGVVWLAVNSTHYMDTQANRNLRERWNLPYPVLVDQDGKAGRAWNAKTTPHMFVISPEGRVVYQGAIDNDPRGQREAPTNYVDQALTEILAGKPVSEPVTRPYGCSLKYAPQNQ